jgi:uncharacterized protein with PIN domain
MPRFLCDAMLGSLARWLRFFGYDACFMDPSAPDEEVARRARDEQRWLLTRDRELASIGPRSMLVRSEDLELQLVEVFKRLELRPRASLDEARCAECNGELSSAQLRDVVDDIPPYVARTAGRFSRCGGCGRVYWPGTHGERILQLMERVLSRLDDSVLNREERNAREDAPKDL